MNGDNWVISDVFQLEKYGERLLARYNQLRKSGELFDLHLNVDGITYSGHRSLLACCSDYFLAMCESGLIPSTNEVDLKGVSPHALGKLMDFMYTGYIELTELDVEEILRGSSLLLMKDVQSRCCQLLETLINCNNALGIWRIADELCCQELSSSAMLFVSDNFAEVCEGEEFVHLQYNHILLLIESDRIAVKSEDQVCNALLKWVDFDHEKRNKLLSRLLASVRLPYLSEKMFHSILIDFPHLADDPVCCKVFAHAGEARKNISLDTTFTIDNDTPVWLRPRICMTEIQAVIAVGGVNALLYAAETDEWYPFAQITTRHCPGMNAANGELFIFGGSREWKRLNTGTKFIASKNAWMTDIEPMQHKRSNFGLVELQGCLYAVGGYDGKLAVSIVECYDPKTNKWRFVASLSNCRDGACIAADGLNLFAATGYNGDQYLSTLECYDPMKDTWQTEGFAEIPEFRENAACVITDGHMYVFGGYHDDVFLSSCERYSIDDNKWTSMAPMSTPRYQTGAAVLNRWVFVCGGWTGAGTASSMVECYKIDDNEWFQACSLPTPCTMRCSTLMFPRKLLMKLIRERLSQQQQQQQQQRHRRNSEQQS